MRRLHSRAAGGLLRLLAGSQGSDWQTLQSRRSVEQLRRLDDHIKKQSASMKLAFFHPCFCHLYRRRRRRRRRGRHQNRLGLEDCVVSALVCMWAWSSKMRTKPCVRCCRMVAMALWRGKRLEMRCFRSMGMIQKLKVKILANLINLKVGNLSKLEGKISPSPWTDHYLWVCLTRALVTFEGGLGRNLEHKQRQLEEWSRAITSQLTAQQLCP